LPNIDMKTLARRGAEVRLNELLEEVRAIRAAFPGLAGARTGLRKMVDGAPIEAPSTARKRKRRKMTAAERKAVSLRMKKYWAGKKKAEK
jgi:hypothetical protein